MGMPMVAPSGGKRLLTLPDLGALAFIIFACFLRLALICLDWPTTSSDEGTLGLAALHIAYHGAHPIFFYGQAYMGTLEAYIGAVLFHLFGPSLLSLRLGLLLLFAPFLLSTYLLTSLLANKKAGLTAVGLLSLGSDRMLLKQLEASGGYAESLLFGSLAFLLATWLACTADRATGMCTMRRCIFGAWGLVVGLGLWSDPLILPFLAAAGLLLFLCCRSELLGKAGCYALVGLLLGGFPVIAYNLHAASSQTTLHALLQQEQGSRYLAQEVAGTALISVPTATGGATICGVAANEAWPLARHPSAHTLGCTVVHGSWTLGLLLLWSYAVMVAARVGRARVRLWPRPFGHSALPSRQIACLLLLAAAGIAVCLFVLNPAAAATPRQSARYLEDVLIAVPAVSASLFGRQHRTVRGAGCRANFWKLMAWSVTGAMAGVLVFSTFATFGLVGAARQSQRSERALIGYLLQRGVTHFYTDYWTCDRLAFDSRERLICGVLDDRLHPGLDRYLPYRALLRETPWPIYLFPLGSLQDARLSRVPPCGPRVVQFGYALYMRAAHEPGPCFSSM